MALPTDVNKTPSPAPVVFDRDGEVRTTSRDVADLFGKRHDHILRDIGNLIEAEPSLSVGGVPTFGETPYVEPSTGQTYRQYEMSRDGFTLLAMGFTGKKALGFKMAYIAAFNAMERKLRQAPQIDLNNPADLRMLLSNYANDKLELQGQVAEMTPKVEALDRIATAEGSLCVTDAAKTLQVQPKALFSFLRSHRWTYVRTGTTGDVAYQDKLASGLLEHKTTTVHRSDGSEKVITQVRVTPKGLARLASEFQPVATAA